MKRILLFCPHFMGYEEIIINTLKKNYEVIYIDTESFLSEKRKIYNNNNFLLRASFKKLKVLREKYREKLLSECDNDYLRKLAGSASSYLDLDTVLAINGDGISNNIYEHIKKNNPKAKFILYIWDDFSWLFKQKHLIYFDKIVSYNIEDCKKHNFSYMPVFTQLVDSKNELKKCYDITIIATANAERVKLAKSLYNKYKDKYKFFIYFYCIQGEYNFFSNAKPLAFEEYITKVKESRAVLEIVRHNQIGPTTRIFDSLAAKTKVITTNNHIKNYPVYSDNILVLDKNYNIPDSFMSADYIDTDFKPLFIDEWLDNLLE